MKIKHGTHLGTGRHLCSLCAMKGRAPHSEVLPRRGSPEYQLGDDHHREFMDGHHGKCVTRSSSFKASLWEGMRGFGGGRFFSVDEVKFDAHPQVDKGANHPNDSNLSRLPMGDEPCGPNESSAVGHITEHPRGINFDGEVCAYSSLDLKRRNSTCAEQRKWPSQSLDAADFRRMNAKMAQERVLTKRRSHDSISQHEMGEPDETRAGWLETILHFTFVLCVLSSFAWMFSLIRIKELEA